MKRWVWLSMSVVLVVALGVQVAREFGAGGRQPAFAAPEDKGAGASSVDMPFKPVAPLEVVMEKLGDMFDEMMKFGEDDPKFSAKELRKFKKSAGFLSELFNVVRYHKKEKDFGDWATKNRDQFLAFAAGCDKGDMKALKELYSQIDKTCTACHDKYRDKDEDGKDKKDK